MFRRLLTVVSLDVSTELVSMLHSVPPVQFGVDACSRTPCSICFRRSCRSCCCTMSVHCALEPWISTGTVPRMGIPTIVLGFYHSDQPPSPKKLPRFRQHRIYRYGHRGICRCMSAPYAAHRGGEDFVAVHRWRGQPPHLTALTVFARRPPASPRAGRQSRGADRLRPSAHQHPRNVSDHQQSLRVHGQPDRTE